MLHSAGATNKAVGQQVMEDLEVQTKHATLTAAFYFVYLRDILHNAAINAVLEARRLWASYHPRLAFVEEGVIMPPSALSFIVIVLLAFAQIKSQGEPGFPFKTHTQLVRVSFTSLLMYGFASAAELILSAAGFDGTSVYAIISRFGKIGSLLVLVASLASLFCF